MKANHLLATASLLAAARGHDIIDPAQAAADRVGMFGTKEENGTGGTGGAGGQSEAEKAAAAIVGQFDKVVDEIKGIAVDAKGRAERGETLAQSTKEKADEALLKMNGLREEFDQLAQKLLAGDRGGNGDQGKSLGEAFTDSESFKNLAGSQSQRGKAEMQIKATLTSLTTDAAGSVGDMARPALRVPGVIEQPQRRMTVRDLLTPGQMDTNSLEYVRQTGFVNYAAPVAEGARKPESDIKADLVATTAKVIAHYMKASRQIMDDSAQLRTFIDNQLVYGLAFREEAQLLNGDGTGQNLLGIIPQATAYSAAFAVDSETAIDKLRLAMLQAVLAEYPATGHVLNPTDWARIELTKDANGRHIIGNPQGAAAPTLWGLPVVATPSMSVDKFLTGAFRLGAQIFDRWLARVELATENEDDFVKNLVTILAEERLALAVYRPEAFIYGDLGFVA